MNQLVILVKYNGEAGAPEGAPPRFTVRGQSEDVILLEGDRSMLPEKGDLRVAGDDDRRGHFQEDATITLGDKGDRLTVSAVSEGTLGASAENGVMQGSVIWQVERGDGRFIGASGLVTACFTAEVDSGKAKEYQVLSLFLPS